MDQPAPLQLSLSFDLLDRFMPMNLIMDARLRIQSIGPTLDKILDETDAIGTSFFDVFDVRRPQSLNHSVNQLLSGDGKLKVNLRNGNAARLSGLIQKLPDGGGFLANFSLGAGVVTVKENAGLVASDFAPTDPSIDMLYMIEVQKALIDEARKVTLRMNNDRSRAIENNWWFFFEHDVNNACCKLIKDEKGRIRGGENIDL